MDKAKNFGFKKYIYRNHAQLRMFERNITTDDAEEVIEYGEIIEKYPDDTPYPSWLIFKIVNHRPLHVVVAASKATDEGIIISLYEPSSGKFESDFKTRKRKKL